jgi:hypothetical protein
VGKPRVRLRTTRENLRPEQALDEVDLHMTLHLMNKLVPDVLAEEIEADKDLMDQDEGCGSI